MRGNRSHKTQRCSIRADIEAYKSCILKHLDYPTKSVLIIQRDWLIIKMVFPTLGLQIEVGN